jgi:hypothetical protein
MLATTADIRDAAVSGSAFRRRGRLADLTLEGYCRQGSLGNGLARKRALSKPLAIIGQ